MTANRITWIALMALAVPAAAQGAKPATPNAAPEIVVYMSELPKGSLYEMETWKNAGSPGAKLLGVTNHGDELDPPPENDPHATFKVAVRAGVTYRCWLHMKVGKPKGKSQANLVYAQFTDAVDGQGKPAYRPRTKSYMRLEGPTTEGWTWVGGDAANGTVKFGTTGTVTVRLQAGMEGVGFDQLVLSPARFQEKPPAEAVVKK